MLSYRGKEWTVRSSREEVSRRLPAKQAPAPCSSTATSLPARHGCKGAVRVRQTRRHCVRGEGDAGLRARACDLARSATLPPQLPGLHACMLAIPIGPHLWLCCHRRRRHERQRLSMGCFCSKPTVKV